jgi:hypothetical protein
MAVESKRIKKSSKAATMTVRLGESTMEWLEREAERRGIGPSTLARMFIIQKLGEEGGPPPTTWW